MAEEYIPISKARAEIAKCANLAQTQMRRYVLTTQGDPKVVLLGYEDYRTLKATASLARRPEVIRNIRNGMAHIREGKTIPLAEFERQAKFAAKQARDRVFIVTDPSGHFSHQDIASALEEMGLTLSVQKPAEPVQSYSMDLFAERPAASAKSRQAGNK